jgi:hypothetical protein
MKLAALFAAFVLAMMFVLDRWPLSLPKEKNR